MDEFTQAYITCALWSSNDIDDTPLDYNFSEDDFAEITLAQIKRDCKVFQEENKVLLSKAYELRKDTDEERKAYTQAQAGHDFWLTRNGHGAGFWDRGLGDIGRTLTKQCEKYPQIDLYVGDDGKIYA